MTNHESRITNHPADTVAAIATPHGAGGIGVVRISGPQAPSIARTLLGQAPRARHAHLTRFDAADGALIDRGLLLHYPAPHSYTGEDVVELQAHGSAPVLAALLRRVCALGARPARAGEFTERAYLNDKLDLAQAEAVADLIAAGSEAAARAAMRSLDGDFSRRVEQLREALIRLRVHVEAAIDFPEEEIDFLGDGQIAVALQNVTEQHCELLTASEAGQRLRDGLHVVIIGPPNAGKSSLLNALAGTDRAIVTAIPGTTRDLLRESLRIDGVELTLVDTAGLRSHSDDPIEQEGMRRAQAERARADLLLFVVEDGDDAALSDLQASRTSSERVLWLHSKIDRSESSPRREDQPDGTHLWLSAKTRAGLDALIDYLKNAAGGDAPEGSFSARVRHVSALERAGEHLEIAAAHLDAGIGELLAEELRTAHETLGEITGRVHSDDLLGEIFSSFCIGK